MENPVVQMFPVSSQYNPPVIVQSDRVSQVIADDVSPLPIWSDPGPWLALSRTVKLSDSAPAMYKMLSFQRTRSLWESETTATPSPPRG
jgi:hypothetical protein